MAGGLNKLSAAKVAKCATPGYLLDGGGLYLQVSARRRAHETGLDQKPRSGVTKSWSFRYRDRATGRVRELGLGPYPDVSLEAARQKALHYRSLLREGKDPKTERDGRRADLRAEYSRGITFDEAVAAYIGDKRAGWRNAKHAEQWVSTLATYASPVLGPLPVSSIDLPLVRKVLDPIWISKNETASRVRQRIESVLAWATVSGYRSGDNPARWRGHLDHLLPKPSKVKKVVHHAALPYSEIGEFMVGLRAHKGFSALALEFLILVGARTNEVLGARPEEFNLSQRVWTVPANRMKAGKEHIVPLSTRAAEIITNLIEVNSTEFVFKGYRAGSHLSTMAMSKVLITMGREDITVHGFRSTFRDWAGEQTNFPRELIEHALAHQLKDKAEAAYFRSTMPEKRRKLMEAWANYCSGAGGILNRNAG